MTEKNLKNFVSKNWPLASYPSVFEKYLHDLKLKNYDSQNLEQEKLKIESTLSNVDEILKNLKISGSSSGKSGSKKFTASRKNWMRDF